jgi:hypothetical protein
VAVRAICRAQRAFRIWRMLGQHEPHA